MTNMSDYPATFDGVLQLLERLRGPNGCPWDRKQTHKSMTEMLLEECYELIEAIEEDNVDEMVEELGDVLFHVAFQARMAEEAKEFTHGQVFEALIGKLVRRHPHVFGDAQADDAEQVIANWDAIKRDEKQGGDDSILDGLPRHMPALAYAQSVQGRAARTGFDWDDISGALAKVVEELGEIDDAQSDEQKEHELGDLLFSIVNASRWMGIEAESALRHANGRFYRRFTAMERFSRERDLDFAELPLDQKEALWQEAKRNED